MHRPAAPFLSTLLCISLIYHSTQVYLRRATVVAPCSLLFEVLLFAVLHPQSSVIGSYRRTRQAGEETYFRVSKTTRMQKVFNTYAARNGLFLPSLRFLHNGCRVSVEDTPVTLELENHDQLDCFLEQPWTGPLPAMTSANGA